MSFHAAVARTSWSISVAPRRWFRVWLFGLCFAALAASACGGDDDDDSAPPDAGPNDASTSDDGGSSSTELSCVGASGSRIQQFVLAHNNEVSEFLRLHDMMFDETCTFGPASDGSLRCLPQVDGAPFAEGVIRYRDAGCKDPIAQQVDPAPSPRYVRHLVPSTEACTAATPFFYELGAQGTLPVETTTIYEGPGCTALPPPTLDFFEVAAEVPPGAFVGGTETYTDSGRIGMRQVDGADGSRFCDVAAPLRDRDRSNEACRIRLAEDGSTRCLPGDIRARSDVFGDTECNRPIKVALLEPCRRGEDYVLESAGSRCSLRDRVRLVGDLLAATFFRAPDMTCQQNLPDPAAYYEVRASVSPSSFAELTHVRTGSDRLERADVVSADGLRVTGFVWFDTMHNTSCRFVTAPRGGKRCLPVAHPFELTVNPTTRYLDSICTMPIVVATRDQSCLEGAPQFIVQTLEDGTHVYGVGPVQAGLFRLDATCVPEPAENIFYRLGPELRPEQFVGSSEQIE